MPAKVTAVVADAQKAIRCALGYMLGAANIQVIGEAANGAEAVHLAEKLRPMVAVISAEDQDGIAAARRVASKGTRVLLLAGKGMIADDALRVGIHSVVSVMAPLEILQEAIIALTGADDWSNPIAQSS